MEFRGDIAATVAFGIFFAVVVMFWSMKAMAKVYSPFGAPLARVAVTSERRISIPYWNGVLSLYATFFVCAMIFAFTGGSLGTIRMPADPHGLSTQNLEQIRSHLLWGLCVGVLVAALARITAVYSSNSLSKHIGLLTVGTVGLLTFRLILEPRFITDLVDVFIRPAGGRNFPAFVFLMCFCALAATEGSIILCKNWPEANGVPYSLLRDRIEDSTQVEQVFWPSDVASFTTQTLSRIIAKDGLKELCWLTNTAPDDHMPAALEAFKGWLCARHGTAKVEARARRIMSAVTRVIVTTDVAAAELQKLKYVTRVQTLKGPLCLRLLVINAKHAIVHLPQPFKGEKNEQSNCATLVSSPELVQMFRGLFDSVWEDKCFVSTANVLVNLAAAGDLGQLRVASRVLVSHQPVKLTELDAELTSGTSPRMNQAQVRDCVSKLVAAKVIRATDSGTVVASRYVRTCRGADICRRLGM